MSELIFRAKDIDLVKWDKLIKSSPVANWFQTYEAYAFFESLSFLEAFAFAVETENKLKGVVVGYIQKDGGRIKQYFSKRAIIYGGPVLADEITDEELKALLGALKTRLKQKAIYIESRNFCDYKRWRNVIESCGFKYESHYDVHVDTSSMEVVNENMGKSRKRDVRVSFRDGAVVISEPTSRQIGEFYLILKDLYKSKVKTPLVPLEFFEKLNNQPSSKFLLIEYRGEIIGGTVCVGLCGHVVYEMYACGKDGTYKNIFPSEVATYAAIQYAAENGFKLFDMMGAGKPDDGGYGVRDFKLKFGGKLVEFGRFVCVCNSFLFQIGKLGVKIMKRI